MAFQEIPMLRCSVQFKNRLIEACDRFNDPKYFFRQRVNWSYRFSSLFFENETRHFCKNPDGYINGAIDEKPLIDNVYEYHVSLNQAALFVIKIVAHWMFRFLGGVASFFSSFSNNSFKIYRKAYVDDIEQVFEPDQADVLRVVYPFPLNAWRQLKYIRFLSANKHRFLLGGNPYLLVDLVRFLWKRDVFSLRAMETRAQLRHAKELVEKGFALFQLSDEFDVGSLSFCRMLRRYHVKIVNSAHGVGTYMPIHSYDEFVFLTSHQKAYYSSTHECIYTPRKLNCKKTSLSAGIKNCPSSKVTLIFLSQVSASVTKIVLEDEEVVLKRLFEEFGGNSDVRLLYKPHPNNFNSFPPVGFGSLQKIEDVNGCPGVVFVSFFSTCYIDPNFVGHKILLKTNLIYPNLIYGDDENILNMDGLIFYVYKNLN